MSKKHTELYQFLSSSLESRGRDFHQEEGFLGFYHEHHYPTLQLIYLEEPARFFNGIDFKSISYENSIEYLKEVVHPDDIEHSKRKMLSFAEQPNSDKIFSVTHRLKLPISTDYMPYFTCVKVNAKAAKLQCITTRIEPDYEFSLALEHVFQQSYFIEQNIDLYTHFSKREREIISLVCKGESVKQIAEKLFLSVHTIETHKKNIMKKGGFSTKAELMEFALSFNMV